MNRLLRINGIDVDIDDKTSIGITLQTYDVKKPGETFINVSNTFSVPATLKNLATFGLANNPQSQSTKVYEVNYCNYWIDNEKIINNAKIRVEGIQERIDLFIYEKQDIWDQLKRLTYTELSRGLMDWLWATKGVPSPSVPYTGTSQGFIDIYSNTTEGIILPMFMGNLYQYVIPGGSTPRENFTTIYLEDLVFNGGHFCVYLKTIFEYLEYNFNVNFLTSGGVLPGNIWDDPIAPLIYIPFRNITTELFDVGGGNVDITIDVQTGDDQEYKPYDNVKDKEDKTAYDLVVAFIQHFNLIKDELVIGSERIIRLARFDELENAEVLEFSDRLSGTPKFKPSIEGYAQENYIKFKEIYPEGDSLVNSKKLECLNANLDVKTDLFEIDTYIPSIFLDIDTSNGDILDMSTKESFKTFQFFISNGITPNNVTIKIFTSEEGDYTMGVKQLQLARIYDLTSEYNFLDEIITYPKFYEIEKWLTIADLKNFEFFKQYHIKDLNGSFFINKIKGFNPEKSKKPTTLEVIKVGTRTPVYPPFLNYWTDGVADGFVDSENDYWF